MTTSITDGQKKQYKRFVEDAAEKALDEANLDKDSLQRLIANGGAFQKHILNGVREFSGGDGRSTYMESKPSGYAAGYTLIDIAEQTYRLNQLALSGPSFRTSFDVESLPDGAENWFLIPRWEALASTYQDALTMVFNRMRATRCFASTIELQSLRRHPRSAEMLAKIATHQATPNALIIPAQFGLRHRSRSMRAVRAQCEGSSEFPLGAFEAGIMLLTHPERIREFSDLSIDCPGDEIASRLTSEWNRAPCFSCDDGLGAGAREIDQSDDFGAVTGFLPRSMTNPINPPRVE